MSIEKEFLAEESGVDYDEYMSDKSLEDFPEIKNIKTFTYCVEFLLGSDIDSVLDEAIEGAILNLLYASKIKHIEYLKFRKKRIIKNKGKNKGKNK
jgi:hypothetical protein